MRPCSLLLIAACWLPAIALAHKPSDSYLILDETRSPMTLQWDIALRDLDYLLGLDRNGDGALTWGEVRVRHDVIAAHAHSNLKLTVQGRTCPWTVQDQRLAMHSDGAYARITASLACDGMPDELTYGLLFEADPTHRGILRVISGSGERTAILSPERRTWSTHLPRAAFTQTFTEYWREGVWHIWFGIDHVLFLLTLLLSIAPLQSDQVSISQRRKWNLLGRTFYIVTGFTLGHSATLGLAAFGLLEAPSSLVEPAIAVTLVLAAVNNLYRILPGPAWSIAALLGLIHGLGFAAVLSDVGLPTEARLTALLGFNLGVESGQLAIVLASFPLIRLLSDSHFYRRRLVPAASLLVSAVGFFWLIERSASAFGHAS